MSYEGIFWANSALYNPMHVIETIFVAGWEYLLTSGIIRKGHMIKPYENYDLSL